MIGSEVPTVRWAAALLLSGALLVGQTSSGDTPFLVPSTRGHSATPHAAVFSPDGRLLYTAGEDKIIHVWNVRTGRLVELIRGYVEEGQNGKIRALAVSRDGNLLASAGSLYDKDNRFYIRLYDLTKPLETKVGLLADQSREITSLAFSPDGTMLASGSVDGKVRLWRLDPKRPEMRVLSIPSATADDFIHSVSFSHDGWKIASAGRDGKVHLWDARSRRLLHSGAGHDDWISSVAFSPKGGYLASVSEDRKIILRDPNTAAPIRVLATVGQGVSNLSFDDAERRLLVCSNQSGLRYQWQLFDLASAKLLQSGQQEGTIFASAISPDGRTIATVGGLLNEARLWDAASGKPIAELVGIGRPVYSVGFAKDGSAIAFGNRANSQTPNAFGSLEQIFYLHAPGLDRVKLGPPMTPADVDQFYGARPSIGDLSLRTVPGKDGSLSRLEVRKANQVACTIDRTYESGLQHVSFTLTPDGRHVISGGIEGVLKIYRTRDCKEESSEFTSHTGTVYAVSVSPDGKTLLSGSDDQTMKLWDVEKRQLLLTILVGSNAQWIAWTAQGYYTSSTSGDRYVGWQINRGRDRLPLWFSAAQFERRFYNPDVITALVNQRDLGRALASAGELRPKPALRVPGTVGVAEPKSGPTDVVTNQPPEVRIESPPATLTEFDRGAIAITAAASSPPGRPLKSIKVLVNGRVQVEKPAPSPSLVILNSEVRLESGENTIQVVADNGIENSQFRRLLAKPKEPTATRSKPNLFVLAVGISEYQDKSFSLKAAHLDAQAIADVFRKQENGPLFSKVDVKLLKNQDADRENIGRALEQLKRVGTEDDVWMVYLSGHAALVEGDYYFLAHKHDPTTNVYDVRWKDVMDHVAKIPGRVILMVDTCHAAAIVGETRFRNVQPITAEDLLAEDKRNHRGNRKSLFFYAAAASYQLAQESSRWNHGAMTYLVLRALRGEETGVPEIVKTDDLGAFLRSKLSALTGKQQDAVVGTLPFEAVPFPLHSRTISR